MLDMEGSTIQVTWLIIIMAAPMIDNIAVQREEAIMACVAEVV